MECALENITVHYETVGEGRPILFIPGWGLNTRLTAHDMEPCFHQREGWKRIYIDPPGHGKTPGKDWITNQDKMLEIILACIDKLTTGQKYCLFGLSLGAYLARGVLLHRARSVDGIAMIVPVIIAENEKRSVPPHNVLIKDPTIYAELTPMEEEIFGMSVIHSRTWLDTIRSSPEIPDDENGDFEFLSRIRDKPENYAFSFDVDAVSEPFPGPSLIITGRQDSVAGYRDAWNILENYPRASYVVLDRAGHPLEDSAGVICVLINEWLDRVGEYIERSQKQ
jgi:pimeloyl-ACP methyl ester carboxylesterase